LLVGLLLVGLAMTWGTESARAAIWPLSLFVKPPPVVVKRHKPKAKKPLPGTTIQQSNSR
jgi:hypothetical protein